METLLEKTKAEKNNLEKQLVTQEILLETLQSDIELFSDNDRMSEHAAELFRLTGDTPFLEASVVELEKKYITSRNNLSQSKEKLKKERNFFSKFWGTSTERKNALIDLEKLQRINEKLFLNLEDARARLKNNQESIIENEKILARFDNYNATEKQFEIFYTMKEIDRIKSEIPEVERTITEISSALDEDYKLVAALQHQLLMAEHYDKQLKNAEFPSDRGPIHSEVRRKFGNGSPAQIIRELSVKIDSLQTKINRIEEKIERRIKFEKSRKDVSKQCEKIFIDGSNLCYKNGTEFIGLKALITVTDILNNKFSLHIIFDNSILSKLRMDFQEIRDVFSQDIAVSLETSTSSADESLIDLCSDDVTSYVLSNDKFIDYSHKDAVRNNKIIGINIFDENILLPVFNINTYY